MAAADPAAGASHARRPVPAAARLADDADWRAEPVDVASVGTPLKKFSWLSARTLWRSRNNVLASLTGDPTENARRAWVHQQSERLAAAGAGPELARDFTISRDELEEFDFVVLGDTGEGDRSQYSVVPALLATAQGTEFIVVASDVVYPAGDVNEYIPKFFVPFAGYPKPVYAIPGNHDWLDGLAGFMRHFCDAIAPAEKFRPPRPAHWRRLALIGHSVLWRRPRALQAGTLEEAARLRGEAAASGPAQPNMYFCIDTPHLRVVAIDAGILGRLDHDQGEWLKRVSAGPKPKILISGKPVWAGPDMSPRRILPPEGGPGSTGTLWGVIAAAENNYFAMISGDVHHYERHSVALPDGRRIECVISGGGGAFMSSTHQIGRVDGDRVDESSWTVFPTRADSLRAYSISLQRRWRRRSRWGSIRGIPADEAAAVVAERHGLDPVAELSRGEGAATSPPVVSRRSRRLVDLIYPRRAWFPADRISEALDWDDPPFFKNFMRVRVGPGRLVLTAYGVSGLARDAGDPPVIDEFVIETGSRREGGGDGSA